MEKSCEPIMYVNLEIFKSVPHFPYKLFPMPWNSHSLMKVIAREHGWLTLDYASQFLYTFGVFP